MARRTGAIVMPIDAAETTSSERVDELEREPVPILWRFVNPWPLPPVGSVRVHDRARVIIEILSAYGPLLRRLRENDLRALVRLTRVGTPRRAVPAVAGRGDIATANRLGKMVVRVLTVLPTDRRCLIRSLVLLRLLNGRGIPATLVIGVSNDDSFSAHAWIECGEVPVLPPGVFHRLIEL